MATNQLKQVVHTLREATAPQDRAGLTDGQLLEIYVTSREESAFAALVRRHGPMVWGVCRRVLGGHQDAEDAFQATFLVLVRRAAAVSPRDLVASWLYGVAHQTALKARATTAKRRGREKQVTAMPEPAIHARDVRHDQEAMLDQELSRLPDKYRSVIILCDLEGKTRKEAARHFRVPEGTVASRLATARAMLAKRLTRNGATVSGAALVLSLSHNTTLASMPSAVAATTIKAATIFAAGQTAATGALSAKAVVLAEGVLKAMLLTKLKVVTAALAGVLVVSATAAALTQQVLATKPVAPPNAAQQQVAQKPPESPPTAEKKEPVVPPIKAKKEDEAIPTFVMGVVKAVDVGKGTLCVTNKDGEGTFTVAKDASVEIDGKPGQLSGLPEGAIVNLRQFVDARTARVVQANGPWFWGVVVKSVDAEKRTITVNANKEERTFGVAKDAFISVDGKMGPLSAVPPGAHLDLALGVDQRTVCHITAKGEGVGGIVKAVDVEKSTITVNNWTLCVAADASIEIDFKGQPAKLSEIPPGAQVNMTLRVDGKSVGRIQATGSSVFTHVKSVDAEKNTITVAGNPDDKTYRVAPDTVIMIDEKPGKLAAIPPGSYLHAMNLRVDQQTAGSINAYGPSYHHVGVKAVDADKNTITIDDRAPPDVAGKTYPLATDPRITIDGKSGKLAGIPVGAFVNLGLSVDGKTARVLDAEGPGLGGCGGSEVSSVSLGTNTITFAANGCPDVAGKTFKVRTDAYITINGKPGKLAEVPPGAFVNATLAVDGQTIRVLSASGGRLNGTLKAVEIAKRGDSITVIEGGADRTFTLAKDVWVQIDSKNGCTLAELRTGAAVTLYLHADRRTVGGIAATNVKP
jgi:RNA polymerase sigma factor (sigma-70 family)